MLESNVQKPNPVIVEQVQEGLRLAADRHFHVTGATESITRWIGVNRSDEGFVGCLGHLLSQLPPGTTITLK